MTQLKWSGLHGGYVSDDGRFYVTTIEIQGRRKCRTLWTVYGVVFRSNQAFRWTDEPISVTYPLKREAQQWACESDYKPPMEDAGYLRKDTHPGRLSTVETEQRVINWSQCRECGVRFDRPIRWLFDDYCGRNCFQIVEERISIIRARLSKWE